MTEIPAVPPDRETPASSAPQVAETANTTSEAPPAPVEAPPEGSSASEAAPEPSALPEHERPDEGREGRRRRERRPRHQKPAGVRADGSIRSLSGLIREILRNEAVEPDRFPESLEITLRIPLREQDINDTAARLVQEVHDRIRSQKQAEGALIPGRAYCFRCESVMCEHGRPAKARDVFDGYTSIGRPRFTDFVTLAIDRREPGLERLLTGDSRILAFVDRGDALKTEQLSEFGKTSHVYDLIGQVTAGLFEVGGEHRRAAVSFQAVLVRGADGVPRLKAHYVSAVDILDRAHPSLGRIFHSFQKALEQESMRLVGVEKTQGDRDRSAINRVLPILRDLARDLTHEAKGRDRRTQHALDRTEDRGRPTETAYPDARRAPDASILTDTQEGTIVVLGPKNRAHIFSPDARHVTSVIIRGGNVQKRIRMGRWRPAEPDERGTFRESLKSKGLEEAPAIRRESAERPQTTGSAWTEHVPMETPQQSGEESPPPNALGSAVSEEPVAQAPPEGT